MPETVFIETTIPSYYVARPSRNLIQLARQELTREWWDFQRSAFDLYTSQIVLDEAAAGDPVLAAARSHLLSDVALLATDELVMRMANELMQKGILPPAAARDAIHLATAAAHQIQFLLTWNCRHIANPHIRERVRTCFSRHDVAFPIICTPEEFIGDENNDPEA